MNGGGGDGMERFHGMEEILTGNGMEDEQKVEWKKGNGNGIFESKNGEMEWNIQEKK